MIHALVLLLLTVTPAQERRAEELVHASMRDYDMAVYPRALREAEEAYRLDPLPEILFNIAQTHRALHHWESAAATYERYLAKLPHAFNREQVEQLLAEVREALAAEQRGSAEPPTVVVLSPLPAPPVVVAATPPPPAAAAAPAAAATPSAASVPAEAVAPSPAPSARRHSHATAYALGAVAVVSLVAVVVGIVELESFQSLQNRLAAPASYPSYTAWNADHTAAKNEAPMVPVWEWVASAGGAVALGTGAAAGFTW